VLDCTSAPNILTNQILSALTNNAATISAQFYIADEPNVVSQIAIQEEAGISF
jgi:hypothetical protein